jgi:tRNA(Ile)-lysidine synthase
VAPVDALPALRSSAAPLLGRCTFPAHADVTCAVSGGADSLALLCLAVAAGCRPTAVHVDHGLRPGSDREFDVVLAAADRLGVPARSVRIDLDDGPNLEARARAARYAVLPDDVMTGHTADDRAETVLVNLLRGSGLDGLAGIRPSVRRPILALRRHETLALCRGLGLAVVDDPSNTDPRSVRNRVRHEVLPLLQGVAGRDLVPVLARQADLLADESDLLDELAAAIDPTDARALTAAPPALARRAVRRWLTVDGLPPDAAAVQRVLDVAAGRAIACEVDGGRRIARSGQRLRFA